MVKEPVAAPKEIYLNMSAYKKNGIGQATSFSVEKKKQSKNIISDENSRKD
jgi:hypothetical protein